MTIALLALSIFTAGMIIGAVAITLITRTSKAQTSQCTTDRWCLGARETSTTRHLPFWLKVSVARGNFLGSLCFCFSLGRCFQCVLLIMSTVNGDVFLPGDDTLDSARLPDRVIPTPRLPSALSPVRALGQPSSPTPSFPCSPPEEGGWMSTCRSQLASGGADEVTVPCHQQGGSTSSAPSRCLVNNRQWGNCLPQVAPGLFPGVLCSSECDAAHRCQRQQ